MADVKRNLEQGGGLYINKWWTGIYSNRSPLFTPVSALGIQLIARQDALWEGLNVMITPRYSLQRRYGFLRACSVAFGANEWPLTYFSFQNLSGTVDTLVDTQTNVYTFTSGGKTSIYTKNTTQQSSFNDVGNILYWCDGTVAKKWDGTTVTNMGIVAPATAPTLSYVANGLLNPLIGYTYGYTFVNPNMDHQSTISPISANTGPLNNQTVVESTVTVNVTATSSDGSNATVVCANNFNPGQTVVCINLGYATWLNGRTLTITSATSSQFVAAGVTHVRYGTHAETQGTATMTLSVPNASPYQYTVVNAGTFLSDGGVVYAATSAPLAITTGTPTVGQYSVNAGVYTFAAADANQKLAITYSFSLAASIGVNVVVGGDGSADPQATNIDIYRTDDGGAIYYYLATVSNPGAGNTWSYTDSTADSGLNNDLIAPVADQNNPPPSGMSLLTWYAGRLWGASGNTLYYSGGPDTLNGVGEEAWPPAYNFTVPGNITALLATPDGLIVFTYGDAYALTGTSIATFTVPILWQANYGVANQNQVTQDGGNTFILTTQNQLYNIQAGSTGGSVSALSFIVQDQLTALVPSNCYLAVHRSGVDEGVFLSDGSTNLWRYSQVASAWDPVYQPVGGVGAISSIEMGNDTWRFLMGRAAGVGYILERDLNTFSDDGTAYPAWAIVGSLSVAPPRQVANIASVLTQLTAVGTYPTISVLLNEIADTGSFPATFVPLPNPVPDPPQLPPSQTLWTRRHDFKAAQSPLSGHVSHMQIKVTFAIEAAANELLGLGLA